MKSRDTRPGRAHLGEAPTSSVPAGAGHGENSSSTLVEAPQKPGRRKKPLDPHDFPDGGGSGGAEAYRRTRTKP